MKKEGMTIIPKAHLLPLLDTTAQFLQDNAILTSDSIDSFCLFSIFIWIKSYSMYLLCLLCSILRSWAPFRLLWLWVVHSCCIVSHVWTFQNLIIHMIIDGHFGHFQFFPITNSDAVNILIRVFWWTWYLFLLDLCLEVGLLSQRICIYSALVDISQDWLYKFTLPSALRESSCVLFLPALHIICLFHLIHSIRCGITSWRY